MPPAINLVNDFSQLSPKLLSRDDIFYCDSAQKSILGRVLAMLLKHFRWSFGEVKLRDGRKGTERGEKKSEDRKGRGGEMDEPSKIDSLFRTPL